MLFRLFNRGYLNSNGSVTNCPCRNIVSFYDVFVDKHEDICVETEYMDAGSLEDIINTGGCDDEQILSSIAYQILNVYLIYLRDYLF